MCGEGEGLEPNTGIELLSSQILATAEIKKLIADNKVVVLSGLMGVGKTTSLERVSGITPMDIDSSDGTSFLENPSPGDKVVVLLCGPQNVDYAPPEAPKIIVKAATTEETDRLIDVLARNGGKELSEVEKGIICTHSLGIPALIPQMINCEGDQNAMVEIAAKHLLKNLAPIQKSRTSEEITKAISSLRPYLSMEIPKDIVDAITKELKEKGVSGGLQRVETRMLAQFIRNKMEGPPPILVAPRSRDIYNAVLNNEAYPGLKEGSSEINIIIPDLSDEQLEIIEKCFKITNQDLLEKKVGIESRDENNIPNIIRADSALSGGRMDLQKAILRKYYLAIAKRSSYRTLPDTQKFAPSSSEMESLKGAHDVRLFIAQKDSTGEGLSLANAISTSDKNILTFLSAEHSDSLDLCIEKALPLETLLQQLGIPYVVKIGTLVVRFDPELKDMVDAKPTENPLTAFRQVSGAFGGDVAERYLQFFYGMTLTGLLKQSSRMLS